MFSPTPLKRTLTPSALMIAEVAANVDSPAKPPIICRLRMTSSGKQLVAATEPASAPKSADCATESDWLESSTPAVAPRRRISYVASLMEENGSTPASVALSPRYSARFPSSSLMRIMHVAMFMSTGHAIASLVRTTSRGKVTAVATAPASAPAAKVAHRGVVWSSWSGPFRRAACVSACLKKAYAGMVTPTLSAAASVSAVFPRNHPPWELSAFIASRKL
mmetsp:Transcript_47655/g.118003  ORF Transcript_47655/g.118003 Transcript_47655/m.118003 type:complete len:221 (+) Transcript_47655:325-987(+)